MCHSGARVWHRRQSLVVGALQPVLETTSLIKLARQTRSILREAKVENHVVLTLLQLQTRLQSRLLMGL